ncbi:IS1 transposase [Thiorhodovibrio winogradskyi]|uniref:IS1 transposase n=1 Tax=Thiorhodovibrio winogradskyi TaxID=77007 RepID=A0ABZ0S3L5_9GAMM|nr:IS1 family transposase [Thiorhodovibrio winogradskyi]
MNPFAEQHRDEIGCVLSYFDRVVITGTFPDICHPNAMAGYLGARNIRLFDDTQWAEPLREEIRVNAERLADEAGLKIEFIRKLKAFRKEARVQAILAERGDHPGLVHIFSAHGNLFLLSPLARQGERKDLPQTDPGQVSARLFLLHRRAVRPVLPAGADLGAATVLSTIRSIENDLQSTNQKVLEKMAGDPPKVLIVKAVDAELDEMWSFVGKKSNQRWLWHAIDHKTGRILAYVFGRRKDEVFAKLRMLLKPFGIKKFYTDDWGAYDRGIPENEHVVGKRNTQKIERKHLTLRTRIKRLARKTICFSKIDQMHDIVIGLFINRYEFGLAI